jgi:transposase
MPKPYSKMTPQEQRARDERDLYVLELHRLGYQGKQIAKIIGRSPSVVCDIIKDYRQCDKPKPTTTKSTITLPHGFGN